MSDMFRLVFISLHVRFTVMANRIINFLRRVPVIRLTGKAHANYGLKIFFTVMGVFFVANKKIWMHLLYIAALAGGGALLNQVAVHGGAAEFLATDGTAWHGITARGVVRNMLTLWFFISFGTGLLGLSSVTASIVNHANDKIMLSYMRVNPAVYARSRILIDRTAEILLYIPLLLIAFAIAGMPIWGVAPALLILTGWRLAGECVNLLLFRCTGKHFGYNALSYSSLPVYVLAFIAPRFISPDWAAVLANPFIIILASAPGVLAFLYIRRYPLFGEFLRDKITRNEAQYAKAAAATSVAAAHGVSKWSERLDTRNLRDDKHRHKTGFTYLNSIFFERHRKFFAGKMLKRCGILAAPLAAAVLLAAYLLISSGQSPAEFFAGSPRTFGFFHTGGDMQSAFAGLAPIFLFIASIASMGRVVTASVFSNCDVQMLHYPYYRTRRTILASFRSRFAAILRYNFIVTSVMSVSVIGAVAIILGELDLAGAGIFFAMLTFMGVLFAFSDLFLYYIIQPYDSEGRSKSILFTVVNGATGALVGMQINMQIRLVPYSLIIIAATLVYLGIGMILLLRMAPKNFKLR